MVTIHTGDALTVLRTLESASVNTCVTSPPYFGLRDYGHPRQIGLEKTPADYVRSLVNVFEEVRRILRDDGTLWVNLGDSYSGSGKGGNPVAGKQATNRGSMTIGVLYGTGQTAREAAVTNVTREVVGIPPKNLIGIPWRVAFALQEAGWWLRSDIIWSKPNAMPESVEDRPTRSHEYLFLLAKSATYYYDFVAIQEPAIGVDRVRDDIVGGNKHNGSTTKNSDGGRFVQNKPDKQRGHSRHHQGFNERWDAMSKEAQCSGFRNKRDVWTVCPANYPESHFATFPPDLIRPCILAGCPVGGTVLDPFGGSGTTGEVAEEEGRHSILIEINLQYVELAKRRTQQIGLLHDAR